MIRKVSIKDIRPNPFQTRKNQDSESIKSLADEISQVGLWAGSLRGREHNGHVELCFGHRRLDAVKLLNWKQVDVDVVELTDEEMSLQGMIENLQREGLNDADKAEGVAAYMKIRQRDQQQDKSSIIDELVKALGLSKTRVNDLLVIARWTEDRKEPIRRKMISGTNAIEAERLAGPSAVKTVIEKGLGRQVIRDIRSTLDELPEASDQDKKIKEKVRQQFVQGTITKPEDVVTKAHQIKGQMTRKAAVPPDLIDVIRHWTERANGWTKELDEVLPYIDYIDTQPEAAKRWRVSIKALIEKLEKFA